ncbi:MAG TPA: hypothetical protein VLE70_00570 [Anaerolineae bacterium]|nr:hypothetical protein [Anaerolineae bacterium]
MNDETLFKRIAAITVIIAGVLNLAASLVSSLAVDFNTEFLANPQNMLTAGLEPGAIGLFRWGEILGVFGYCLFLIPATLYLWYWLSPHSPRMVALFTVLGLISIVLCIIESTVRISLWPPMMAAYPQAEPAQREMLQVVFGAYSDFAMESMYALNSILAGLWFLCMGLLLRSARRVLGIVMAIMGAAICCAGIGWITRVDPLARLEFAYFLVPFWAVWLGVVIWKREERSEQLIETAAAV